MPRKVSGKFDPSKHWLNWPIVTTVVGILLTAMVTVIITKCNSPQTVTGNANQAAKTVATAQPEPSSTPPITKSTTATKIEPSTQQTPLAEASPAKQQSLFARGLTADQRKGLWAALSNIYVLTCTYHLDRDAVTREAAKLMYARADAALNQQLPSKSVEPLRSDIDGVNKYNALKGALATYEVQLSAVVQQSDYPGESLNEAISSAKEQRMKLKDALDAICDYIDIAKFSNP